MSQSSVEITLVGDPRMGGEISEADFHVPPDSRRTTTVDAVDSDTLGDVMKRAREEFDVRWSTTGEPFHISFIAFYERDDPYGAIPQMRHSIDLIGADGQILWNQDWQAATILDLRRAANAGLIRGDPSHWYLILAYPMGNGVFLDWKDAALAWFIFRQLIGFLADAEGAKAALQTIANRLRHRDEIAEVPKAYDRYGADWAERGAWPPDLLRLLSAPEWDAAHLATMLGCSRPEVEAILSSHGYEYDLVDGTWRKAHSDEGLVLHDVARALDFVEFSVADNKERLQGRIRAILMKHVNRWES